MISYAHIANIYAYFSFAANWLEKKLEASKMNQQKKLICLFSFWYAQLHKFVLRIGRLVMLELGCQ